MAAAIVPALRQLSGCPDDRATNSYARGDEAQPPLDAGQDRLEQLVAQVDQHGELAIGTQPLVPFVVEQCTEAPREAATEPPYIVAQ